MTTTKMEVNRSANRQSNRWMLKTNLDSKMQNNQLDRRESGSEDGLKVSSGECHRPSVCVWWQFQLKVIRGHWLGLCGVFVDFVGCGLVLCHPAVSYKRPYHLSRLFLAAFNRVVSDHLMLPGGQPFVFIFTAAESNGLSSVSRRHLHASKRKIRIFPFFKPNVYFAWFQQKTHSDEEKTVGIFTRRPSSAQRSDLSLEGAGKRIFFLEERKLFFSSSYNIQSLPYLSTPFPSVTHLKSQSAFFSDNMNVFRRPTSPWVECKSVLQLGQKNYKTFSWGIFNVEGLRGLTTARTPPLFHVLGGREDEKCPSARVSVRTVQRHSNIMKMINTKEYNEKIMKFTQAALWFTVDLRRLFRKRQRLAFDFVLLSPLLFSLTLWTTPWIVIDCRLQHPVHVYQL